jgi:hypothetical protein
MTAREAARLFHLDDGLHLWGYWGVERSGQPRLAARLAREICQFFNTSPEPTSILDRRVGKGRVLLMLPSLRVVGSNLVDITQDDEGVVLLAIEGDDEQTWSYAIHLYRLVRRLYPSRGKGGKPGQICWRAVAALLRESPNLLDKLMEVLTERIVRRSVSEDETPSDSDWAWARHCGSLETRRGLSRIGLKLRELKCIGSRPCVKSNELLLSWVLAMFRRLDTPV